MLCTRCRRVSAASWEVRGALDTGVGGIRRMRLVLGVTRDRIVDGTRPHHHAYAAAFPWYVPLEDYRGDIRIEDRPNGSLIVWTVSCTPRIPGLRNLNQSLQRSYARLAHYWHKKPSGLRIDDSPCPAIVARCAKALKSQPSPSPSARRPIREPLRRQPLGCNATRMLPLVMVRARQLRALAAPRHLGLPTTRTT